VVERGRLADQVGARVDGRAQVTVRDAGDRLDRLGRDVLLAPRPEADDDDAH
jgi:hypothetical protein